MNILEKMKMFPKLRVSLQLQPSTVSIHFYPKPLADLVKITKTPEGVKILLKTDIGFINEKPPEKFAGKVVYVCLLAETSDGRKVHFARLR